MSDSLQSPAVAANDAFAHPHVAPSGSVTTAPADAAGGRGDQRYDGYLIPWVQPVDGWTLLCFEEEDGDGFWAPTYFARSDAEDRLLNVSRFASFDPTQERFAYLVRNDFPKPPRGGPWADDTLDAAIAAEGRAVAA